MATIQNLIGTWEKNEDDDRLSLHSDPVVNDAFQLRKFVFQGSLTYVEIDAQTLIQITDPEFDYAESHIAGVPSLTSQEEISASTEAPIENNTERDVHPTHFSAVIPVMCMYYYYLCKVTFQQVVV